MSIIKLKQLLFESINSGMKLPPGFSITTVEDLPEPKLDEELGGVKYANIGDDELEDYIKRRQGVPNIDKKTGQQLMTKKGRPRFTALGKKTDRYKFPYVHTSTVRDMTGNPIEIPQLINKIKERPHTILKRNAKIQKSGGFDYIFYNIGLPAFKGLIVDEKTNKLKIVNTCPGAGQCLVFCYAKKGGYVMFEMASLPYTRLLNFLINDPEGFKNKMIAELKAADAEAKSKNIKVIIRWHDAGDFFSSDYLKIAYDIARQFPDITFYAYTKLAGVSAGEKPDNFVMNFSSGALKSQEQQVDLKTTKHSIVVPRQMFDGLTHMKHDGDNKKMEFNSPQDLETFKNKISAKYNVERDTVITYDELMKIPYDSNTAEKKYNVLVWAGHGDDAAMRKDVLGTYLLIH